MKKEEVEESRVSEKDYTVTNIKCGLSLCEQPEMFQKPVTAPIVVFPSVKFGQNKLYPYLHVAEKINPNSSSVTSTYVQICRLFFPTKIHTSQKHLFMYYFSFLEEVFTSFSEKLS